MEAGLAERGEKVSDRLLVSRGFQPAVCITKNLPHYALLAHGVSGQNAAQLPGIVERRIGQARDLASGFEWQVDLLRRRARVVRRDEDRLLLAPAADRIEALQPETDGIHQ